MRYQRCRLRRAFLSDVGFGLVRSCVENLVAEFGGALAAAVAIDAFVLRTVLVPAAMYLFGKANWWSPARLDKRLPHLSVEGPRKRPRRAAGPNQPHAELRGTTNRGRPGRSVSTK